MKLLKIFFKGLTTTNSKARVAVYLWLVNLLFSLAVIAPLYFILHKEFSFSLTGERIGRSFDLLWMGDLIYKYREMFPAIAAWLLVPGVLYLGLFIFLNGGIIGRISAAGDEKVSPANFFGDCGRYFFRFFRVFLISLIAYAVLFGIIVRFLSAIFRLWTKNAATGWPVLISSNLRLLITLLLLTAVVMFFDYVKIRLVVEDSKKTIKAVIKTFSFMGRHFFRAWLLYLTVAAVVILLTLVYAGLSRLLPQGGLVPALALFILQQIYIFSRMGTKVLFFATGCHFFRSLH